MAVQNLDLVISVLDKYTKQLDELLLKLEEVALAAEQVDQITIDVDVRGERKLDALMAKMAALGFMDMDDVNVNVRGAAMGGGGPRGGVPGAMGGIRMPDLSNLSRTASNAAQEMSDFNLSMSDLHNLAAKLVPLLFVFVAAMPAVISGMVALAVAAFSAAAGLAALAGFGALGLAMARNPDDLAAGFSEVIDEIQADFLDAFSGLAQRLTGFSERALDGLDKLFQGIASRGDVLVDFTETAAGFGQWLQTFLPNLLADMGKMARAFGPFFGRLMEEVNFSVLGKMTQFMAEMADEAIMFISLLVDFIPLIARLSIGFLQVVNAIGLLVQGFARLLSILPISEQAWGALIGTIMVALSAMLLWKAANLAVALGFLGTLIPSLTATIVAIKGYVVSAAVAAGASTALAGALGTLAVALIAVGGLIAVAGIIGAIASSFGMLESDVTSATKALENFNKVGDDLGRNPYADPDLRHGSVTKRSRGRLDFARGGRGTVVVNIEGNADEDMVREQTGNALYRMGRKVRGF